METQGRKEVAEYVLVTALCALVGAVIDTVAHIVRSKHVEPPTKYILVQAIDEGEEVEVEDV